MRNILIYLLFLHCTVNGQNLTEKIQYSSHPVIASILYDLTAAIKLNDKQLLKLTKYLQTQDGILQQEIKNGTHLKKDLKAFSFEPAKFNKLVGAKPSDIFHQTESLHISLISYALLFREKLKITNIQAEKLLQLNLKERDNKVAVFQLSKILDFTQRSELFALLNEKAASEWAVRDWKKFKEYKITDGLDSITVQNKIFEYRSKRIAFHDFYTQIGLEDSVANGGFRHSTTDLPRVFLDVLKPERYRIYFENSNVEQVSAVVKKNWEDIKLLGLQMSIDSIQAKKQLWDYEMESRFAGNRVFIENSLKSVFARQDLVNNKPMILKKLEKVRSNSINNKF